MSKLTWIACNGVEPDLPSDAKVDLIFRYEYDPIRQVGQFQSVSDVYWLQVIAYALEPDPVKELVEAAKAVVSPSSFSARQVTRLRAAIKAVEDME